MSDMSISLPVWKQLLRLLTEITAKSTAHRCPASSTESCIHRFFKCFAAHNIPLIGTTMVIDGSPLERLGSAASDHKLIQVRIRHRAQRPRAERGIPADLFQSKYYASAAEH
eukprot:7068156-Pyramimonas_sp.AAC.1